MTLDNRQSEGISEVILCTRNRPELLAQLLMSINTQTCKSVVKLIVIDSSSNEETFAAVEEFSSRSDFKVEFVRVPEITALTLKRNIGLQKIDQKSEFVHFFDDDVVLDTFYVENVIEVFKDESIVGVTGRDINRMPQRYSPLKFKLGMGSIREGVILKNGLNILVTSSTEPKQVEWLSGCAMSYRNAIIKDMRFDIRRTFDGEDTDFSFRVSKFGKLYFTPEARYAHLTAEKNFANRNHTARAFLTHLALEVLEFDGKVRFFPTWFGSIIFGFLILGFGIRKRNIYGVSQGIRHFAGACFFPAIVIVWKIKNMKKEQKD